MTRACYEEGQRDFGENYDIDLVNKAKKVSTYLLVVIERGQTRD
jgi:uncharacterized pyridoxal phosphate-containing UPF0001 family protein